MDINTRTVVRPSSLEGIIPAEPQCAEAVCTPAPKLVMPRALEPSLLGSHRVVASDLDYNGHANNAKYVVWSFDALGGLALDRRIEGFEINFNREAHFGDEVDLWHVLDPSASDVHLIEGRVGGAQSFIIRIKLN